MAMRYVLFNFKLLLTIYLLLLLLISFICFIVCLQSFESSQELLFSSNILSEVEKYLESPLHMHGDSKFDILLYWKDQQTTYPIMSKIAKDILAIPITTVASESTFSMGGRILNRWRASLLSRHVEALILTRNWLFGYEEESDEVGLVVGSDLVPDAESHAKGDQGPSGSSSSESGTYFTF